MSRSPRYERAGAIQHVTLRTNRGMRMFEADAERRVFLALLANTVAAFDWKCLSYCLMGNHAHLLVQPTGLTLSHGMQQLATRYARAYNDRRGRYGHVFQGRFGSRPVTRDAYLHEVLRYIALNPVRARLCAHPLDYPWSAHRALMGLARSDIVAVEETLSAFGTPIAQGRSTYGDHVSDLAGAKRFAPSYEGEEAQGSISAALDEMARTLDPDAMILQARSEHGHSFAAIGRALGRNRSSVARRFAKLQPGSVTARATRGD